MRKTVACFGLFTVFFLLTGLQVRASALQPIFAVNDTDMQIFIKPVKGAKFAVDVYLRDTIEAVKQKIEDIQGIPANQQRLIYAGRQLEDGRTLADYNIRYGATLGLITRSR